LDRNCVDWLLGKRLSLILPCNSSRNMSQTENSRSFGPHPFRRSPHLVTSHRASFAKEGAHYDHARPSLSNCLRVTRRFQFGTSWPWRPPGNRFLVFYRVRITSPFNLTIASGTGGCSVSYRRSNTRRAFAFPVSTSPNASFTCSSLRTSVMTLVFPAA
jgi:hypothetical protein